MYFMDEQHSENYDLLYDHFMIGRFKDTQWLATIYIAAVPEIFKCFNTSVKDMSQSSSPLYELTDKDEEGKLVFAAPGLTGSTARLCEVGLSLFNGYPIDLDGVFGSVAYPLLVKVFFTACAIRADHNLYSLFREGE